MTKQLNITEQEELFSTECKLINLKYEYQGYTGTVKWAVVSELSEKELFEKYPDVISRYTPFVLLSVEQGEVIAEAKRNDDKFAKRAKRSGHIFNVDTDDFNNLHTEVSYEPDYIEEICLNELRLLVREGLTMLTDTQRSRLFKYYYEGKSTLVIAQEDGVSYSKITKSLNQALEKIKKLL